MTSPTAGWRSRWRSAASAAVDGASGKSWKARSRTSWRCSANAVRGHWSLWNPRRCPAWSSWPRWPVWPHGPSVRSLRKSSGSPIMDASLSAPGWRNSRSCGRKPWSRHSMPPPLRAEPAMRCTPVSEDEHLHDHCGVVGVFGHPEAAKIAYLGLYALQHRGQESAGIVASDGQRLHIVKGMGLVQEVFTPEALGRLPGTAAIGHTRYSTAGDSSLLNAQPILIDCSKGRLALAHNGNLTNAREWRRRREHRGSIFQTTSDTEVILYLLARSTGRNLAAALAEALLQVEGAYSLVLLGPEELFAARDPRGFRPLCLGRLGEAWLVASETCAFDIVNGTYVREVQPGELVRITASGLESVLLAREHPAPADVVMPVPESGVPAAIGYALESGLPFQMGLIRNHYVGRTFI